MRKLRWVRRHTRAVSFASCAACAVGYLGYAAPAVGQGLPQAPSALLAQTPAPADRTWSTFTTAGISSSRSAPLQEPSAVQNAFPAQATLPPCTKAKPAGSPPAGDPVAAENKADMPCTEENPLQSIIASRRLPPLTHQQKGYLAVRDVIDPFNLVTILANAAVIVGANSHSAYGPGLHGFGSLTGYSLVEDMQGEFVGTFLIPSLAHEDPRYYRMPGRPFARRLLNAVSHTVVTRHDDGSAMLNYATLLTYPASAELANLYVPGVAVDGPSTVKRITLGLATDPVGQIVAEFLPDVAKRIHIRVIFVEQILQQVAGQGGAVATQ